MKVKLKFLARYRELMGQSELEVELEEGSTVAHLRERLNLDHAEFSSALVAVNGQYASAEQLLHPGVEVAFLPPMSGGARLQITGHPIQPHEVIALVQGDQYGAVVTFIGRVRGRSQDKRVLYLEYEFYQEMAQRKLEEIADEIHNRWGLQEVAICHRMGQVRVGETCLVIAVAAPHRQEAFEACQYAIDRLKQIVPIWKKEVFENGEAWVG